MEWGSGRAACGVGQGEERRGGRVLQGSEAAWGLWAAGEKDMLSYWVPPRQLLPQGTSTFNLMFHGKGIFKENDVSQI